MWHTLPGWACCNNRDLANVDRHWENKDFTVQSLFGLDGNVAIFGSMTYMSRLRKITKTSLFAIWYTVIADRMFTFYAVYG